MHFYSKFFDGMEVCEKLRMEYRRFALFKIRVMYPGKEANQLFLFCGEPTMLGQFPLHRRFYHLLLEVLVRCLVLGAHGVRRNVERNSVSQRVSEIAHEREPLVECFE